MDTLRDTRGSEAQRKNHVSQALKPIRGLLARMRVLGREQCKSMDWSLKVSGLFGKL